jgi:3-deoxy-D-manno-octulosonate 8-phosphate phosphatase (KDO 8-P phosphatase)
VREIAQRQGIELDAVAFMGDDLADLVILRACGLAVAPANAHPWIRERVHWRTNLRGGEGAARELCDLLLAAQGHAEGLLA